MSAMTTSMATAKARRRSRSVSLSLTFQAHTPVWSSDQTLETLPAEVILEIIALAAYAPPSKHTAITRNQHNGLPNFRHDGLSDTESDSDEDFTRVTKLYRQKLDVARAQSPCDTHTLLALSRTSRLLAEFAHSVLYRTVKISEHRTAELFAQLLFAPIPTLGRDTSRLILDSDIDPHSLQGAAFTGAAGHWRFHVANGAASASTRLQREDVRLRTLSAVARILSFTGSPSSMLPPMYTTILSSLRTLVVHSSLLAPFIAQPASHDRTPPMPTEIILDTYLPEPAFFTSASASGTLALSSGSHTVLAQLASRTTHLQIVGIPARWRSPSKTIAALGGMPALTHLAVARRANANVDNDDEFVEELERILLEKGASRLTCVVASILPDEGWRSSRLAVLPPAPTSPESADSESGPVSLADVIAISDLSLSAKRTEAYLSHSHVWTRLSRLQRTSGCNTRLCVVPARSDAWLRATSMSSGATDSRHAWWGAGVRESVREDFWGWAGKYEEGRRAREADFKERQRPLASQIQ